MDIFNGIAEQSREAIADDDYDFDINNNQRLNTGATYRPNTAYSNHGRLLASRGVTAGSRSINTAGESRPMTAVSRAGFVSKQDSQKKRFDPLNQSTFQHLEENGKSSSSMIARAMEAEIHSIIEQSAICAVSNKKIEALEMAKDAGKKERKLLKYCKDNSLMEISDLTFFVWFNLALAYAQNCHYDESFHAYTFLLKKKRTNAEGYIRINMGNVYYQQGNYMEAIKMYRMALDLIPSSHKNLGNKICRNIGNSFVRIKNYRQAIQSMEAAINDFPDFQSAINLILCLCTVGKYEDVRNVVMKMLTYQIHQFKSYKTRDREIKPELQGPNEEQVLLNALRILISTINSENTSDEYEWIREKLKLSNHDNLIGIVTIEQANDLLREKKFDKAKCLLTSVIKSEKNNDVATTNLSAISLLSGEIQRASELSDIAVQKNRYNINALVNKGNCYYLVGEYEPAKDMYLEAIGVKANCAEALYNLGLVNLQLNHQDEALRAFEKLHRLLPHNPCVYRKISYIYENGCEHNMLKWYNLLTSRLPNDPGVLTRIGEIYASHGDISQSIHYVVETCHQLPSDLDSVVRLGSWFVRKEMFEKSLYYFQIASDIQPKEPKWQIMVANCHRRLGDTSRAISLLRRIHQSFPRDTDCLRYLISICDELCEPTIEYRNILQGLEKDNQLDIEIDASHYPIHEDEANLLSSTLSVKSEESSTSFSGADISDFLS